PGTSRSGTLSAISGLLFADLRRIIRLYRSLLRCNILTLRHECLCSARTGPIARFDRPPRASMSSSRVRRGVARGQSPIRGIMSFANLGLSEKVQAAVAATGYTTPTPIQAQAIPHVLA